MTDHAVDPNDEQRHTPDADDLWNESYYADFVHEDGSFGGWLRLGLYPNREVAWWTTWIVGPDRPGVCSVNYTVPVPAGTGLVAEDTDTRIELEVIEPLKRFRIAASAPATTYHYAEDAYTDVPGTPVQLDLDLTWTTDGAPYHYELTTRYEIPCLVGGTVTIDGETLTVTGQGQRDHSWGVRDWWAFGWCWSSSRLSDGTRVQLADIRMPGFPVAFGYLQDGDGAAGGAEPVTRLEVTEDLGAHGFPTSARILIGSAERDIALSVTPVAFGPVLLRNDVDGRVSYFPRAMVQVTADDGRPGLGWIEWNQPAPT
ncbi:MAG TPA: hypothetical protein VHV57_02680 [Acidimicrobiales bacterium]|jgi:hypothetical protein|nr:hypothetical protein [Acidimicrobiales bacterium]